MGSYSLKAKFDNKKYKTCYFDIWNKGLSNRNIFNCKGLVFINVLYTSNQNYMSHTYFLQFAIWSIFEMLKIKKCDPE